MAELTTIELDNYTVDRRPSIKEADRVKLWVRSGGRCAYCNKYLLDLVYGVNVGEMAHIVGWTKKANSPRGEADTPLNERNLVENLILLCAEHHKIADSKEAIEVFTVDRLALLKKNHEARIFRLTNLKDDSESVVIRLLGNIRGATVELSQQRAMVDLLDCDNKFAHFLDSFDKQGVEIDLTTLPEPEENWHNYWAMGKLIIDNAFHIIIEGVKKGRIRHLSVFAFSRIPLLVYLGYKLDDKIPTLLFQKHRGNTESWVWPEDGDDIEFEAIQTQNSSSSNVSLVLNISGTIELSTVPDSDDQNIYVLRPKNVLPTRDTVRKRQSLENFTKTYHDFLSQIEVDHKSCLEIRLFLAVPLTVAVVCGRGIMRNVHPSLTIWDYNGQTYAPALTINSRETN
ncbi:SAVED domain-containing protein [Dyadobacter luticola]|uniref:SAVED domain-containing protein n=1 Tax=Dyadobacter luticola TaxID=1979387 RepID=A0A5R9KZ93_9BACT|nr:SAVED domain-containing protein [Dyadobacter luticola]TLV01407.1 SAVED domain-containing protein [Dyadobacter luticola]